MTVPYLCRLSLPLILLVAGGLPQASAQAPWDVPAPYWNARQYPTSIIQYYPTVPSTYDGYRASTTSFGVSHSSERLNSSNSDGTSPESRQYSANQKLGIIKAHLVDGLSIEYLCDRYKIRADEYTQWQQRLFTNGQGAFDADPGKDSEQDAREETDSESEVRQLKKKLAARNELITRQLQDRENDKNEE